MTDHVDSRTDLAIDVSGLNKSFGGRKVVNDFGIKVPKGHIVGFLGPNGSGKTTTIRLLCGLLTPDSGHGTCLGYDIITQAASIKRHVGYMTQRFSLYEDLSIRENLDFVARMYGVPDRAKAVKAAIERLGLAGRSGQMAGALSGGWKQRLSLAACLLHQPQLLLLDEPTAGVDPKARRDFWDQIHALATDGITVLVSTHYMDEAERCHELAYIAYGNLLVHGTAEDIVRDSHLATWSVFGKIDAELAERLRRTSGVDMVVPFGAVMHVSGRDGEKLDAAIAPFRDTPGLRWEKSAPTLEDVFIDLMRTAPDNFETDAAA